MQNSRQHIKRILGLDPGLANTGWGMINSDGHRLEFIDCGIIMPNKKAPMGARLFEISTEAFQIIERLRPDEIAIEEIFVNKLNPNSALKLGMARGILLMLPQKINLNAYEYNNRTIKQAVTGSGRADKIQVQQMVGRLLPESKNYLSKFDISDALAIAITHALQRPIHKKWEAQDVT